jgi:perosamine synthetase
MTHIVPFYRPEIGTAEIEEVVATLQSGWLTTGPKVQQFEREFAESVGARFSVAVNSCTAALHLAVESLGLKPGQGVLVPTLTFAATAEIVRYLQAVPILIDCDPMTLQMNLADAASVLAGARPPLPNHRREDVPIVGIIPVHVGGCMMNVDEIRRVATAHNLWVVEDAAHAYPAAWRPDATSPWTRCGERTSDVSCFSFYANKTITTGEGGMAVTDDEALAARMRMMSLHGLSSDAWGRYSGGGSWDYRIAAPGYKYNLTDVAGAIGIHQRRKAEAMRRAREAVARRYLEALREIEELELPYVDPNCLHAWHLFPIRLRLERLTVDRATFIQLLGRSGVGCSVHWRPLHLHPYYADTFGYKPSDLPAATSTWPRLVSLPIFSSMTDFEVDHVIASVRAIISAHRPEMVAMPSQSTHTHRANAR